MIKAFIFDLDGTLFDTVPANIQAYTRAFAASGLVFDAEAYRRLFGLRFPEMMDVLAPTADATIRNQIKADKARYYSHALELAVPNSGLLALLAEVSGSYRTALTTTASGGNVHNLMQHFNLPETIFDVIVVGEDVQRGKPDPECYIKTVAGLQVAPEECCVFEDSEIGIQAARSAGTQVVRVTI